MQQTVNRFFIAVDNVEHPFRSACFRIPAAVAATCASSCASGSPSSLPVSPASLESGVLIETFIIDAGRPLPALGGSGDPGGVPSLLWG